MEARRKRLSIMSAVPLVLASSAGARGGGFVPLQQARGVEVFVETNEKSGPSDCDYDGASANGFGMFNGMAEATASSANAFATGYASQQSEIRDGSANGMSMEGFVTLGGCGKGLLGVTVSGDASSDFDVTFSIPDGASYALVGLLGGRNALCRLEDSDGNPVVSFHLMGGPDIPIDERGSLPGGTYRMIGSASRHSSGKCIGGASSIEFDLSIEVNIPVEPIGEQYCSPGIPNSTGEPGSLVASGTDNADGEDVLLTASDLPPGNVCLFLASANQGSIQPPLSCGILCLMGPDIARFKFDAQLVDADGRASMQIDPFLILTNPPQPILAGQTWNFQAWHRDADAGPGCTNNFTDAVEVLFTDGL